VIYISKNLRKIKNDVSIGKIVHINNDASFCITYLLTILKFVYCLRIIFSFIIIFFIIIRSININNYIH